MLKNAPEFTKIMIGEICTKCREFFFVHTSSCNFTELRNCDVIEDKKKTLLQVLALCVSPNFRCSSKCFAETYRAQYENAMLVNLHGTLIWRPENSVNIWNLLWLSRRVIISTEKTSIYISTFPNALASNRAPRPQARETGTRLAGLKIMR